MDRRKFLLNTSLAGAAGLGLAKPALAQSRREINIVSVWGRDAPGAGVNAQRLASNIETASDGAIKVNYFAAGERVGAFDVFDEVAAGNSQAYNAPAYYWTGTHPAYSFFTAVPFGMTMPELKAWVDFMGGQELWDELAGSHGMKSIATGGSSTQMGGWFNKEINTPEDLRGLKIRYPGTAGDVMTRLGASAVSLPGPQIYENLVSGAIDAAEWIGPYNDYFMKFYEAAKYYYYPGFHEPGSSGSLTFNASFWGQLTETEKTIIETCCYEAYVKEYAEGLALNGEYARKLVEEHGVELREFNQDLYEAFYRATEEVIDEIRQHSDIANRIAESYYGAMRDLGRWGKMAESGYSERRNRAMGI